MPSPTPPPGTATTANLSKSSGKSLIDEFFYILFSTFFRSATNGYHEKKQYKFDFLYFIFYNKSKNICPITI
jgi:hypothetical protein